MNLNFSSRCAESRTYIYRLGHLKNSKIYWDELERISKVEKCLTKNSKNRTNHFAYLFPANDFITPFETNLITRIR